MQSLYPIYVNYPIAPKPRFGALHGIVAGGRARYEAELRSFARYSANLAAISFKRNESRPEQPCWDNDWFTGLDALALYGKLAAGNPARYYEIGSGNSTMFARRAVADLGLRTEIVSLDPFPREEIDGICDRIVRMPLEEADLSLFGELEDGDVLFVDSSHYLFQNSDANIAFLEILPGLRSGVNVHFHDIFLPDDYPASWSRRYYNEQYLLAAYLLAQKSSEPVYETTFPSYFVSRDAELAALARAVLDPLGPGKVPAAGGSYWLKKC